MGLGIIFFTVIFSDRPMVSFGAREVDKKMVTFSKFPIITLRISVGYIIQDDTLSRPVHKGTLLLRSYLFASIFASYIYLYTILSG
jgi:hypothetical protein